MSDQKQVPITLSLMQTVMPMLVVLVGIAIGYQDLKRDVQEIKDDTDSLVKSDITTRSQVIDLNLRVTILERDTNKKNQTSLDRRAPSMQIASAAILQPTFAVAQTFIGPIQPSPKPTPSPTESPVTPLETLTPTGLNELVDNIVETLGL